MDEPLPLDAAMLQQQLLAKRQQHAEQLQARDQEIGRLTTIIKALQRHRFGRRAEPLDQDQLALALEDVEQTVSAAEAAAREELVEHGQAGAAAQDQSRQPARPSAARGGGARRCRQALCLLRRAEGLHRRGRVAAAGRGAGAVQGDRHPAAQYACRACQGEVAQAAAPERLIENGLPTEALVAQVLVAKYADHLPLYRQAQIWARQGIDIDRSTLADWVGRAAFELAPVHARLLKQLRGSAKLFADETTVPVLDPGRGRTRTGHL